VCLAGILTLAILGWAHNYADAAVLENKPVFLKSFEDVCQQYVSQGKAFS